jgi:hypothetical protein
VQKDAYHTASALTFVTPYGAVIDTSKPDAEKNLQWQSCRLRKACSSWDESFWQIRSWQTVCVASTLSGTRTDCGFAHFSTVKRRWRFF